MKFAILGTDADIVQLAAAARTAGHEIIWLGDVRSEDAAAIGPLVSNRSDQSVEWELLLGQGVVNGVLVGQGRATDDTRTEQLKRLVTEGIPLLVVHPIFESVLPYYEIDMARQETGAIVQHFNPLTDQEVWADLSSWVRDGHPTIGTIHQVTCEHRAAGTTRAAVLAHLARDIEILAQIAGDIRRVSAIGPATLESSFASLQVQMSALNVPALRWSVGSTAAAAGGLQIALIGERGTVSVRETEAVSRVARWELVTASVGVGDVRQYPAEDSAAAAIERFVAAISERDSTRRAAASTWGIAIRDMEVVDAVELSLQKGRTIEVFQQQLTERLAFRGTMAAFGCALLLIAFFVVVAIALLGGAEGIMRQRIAPAWPGILLAVLAFFLLLQAIPMMAQKSRESKGKQPPSPSDEQK